MSAPTAHRISLLAALGLIGLTVYAQLSLALQPCGGLAPNYAPVLAFELARSVADLQAIFGGMPSACRSTILERMNTVNMADSLFYIPLYGAFLVFFFAGLLRQDRFLARIGIAFVVIAVVADYAENACLFRISEDPDVESMALDNLFWITSIKWLGLAVAGFVGGLALAQRGSALFYVGFGLCAFGVTLTGLALGDPHNWGAQISNGILASWIVFLVLDIRESFRTESFGSQAARNL